MTLRPWEDAAWREAAQSFARSLDLPPGDDRLIFQALTHRSLAEETPVGDNERLEFLGDSVLALIVNDYLYRQHPDYSEGQLTKLKARYVSQPSLADAAAGLGLGPLLAIAPGDDAAGGRLRPSTLSDAFEAVLAVVYLARGLDAAREFVRTTLLSRVDIQTVWDHKSRLQEWYQERHKLTPAYDTVVEGGPAHEQTFRSRVLADDAVLGEGTGRSKKQAEQAAAADALLRLEGVKGKRRKARKSTSGAPAPETL